MLQSLTGQGSLAGNMIRLDFTCLTVREKLHDDIEAKIVPSEDTTSVDVIVKGSKPLLQCPFLDSLATL